MGKIYIGTSGWVYSHWEGIFYPEELSSKDYNPPTTRLKYFSQHFKTAEVNYSFYHLPKPTTYQNWYSQTPGDFLFSMKASRYITHIKRLKNVKESWKVFIGNALNLKEKLGPILFQFPPSFKATEENIERLEKFLELSETRSLSADRDRVSVKLRFAFEFRHGSWCQDKIYNLLQKHNTAWVIACPPIGWSLKATGRRADSPNYPKAEELTADFVYVRMHGSKVLFSSKYTEKELKDLAEKIKKWLKNKDVFVYFNNDAYGYAIENAKTLTKLLKS